MKANKIIIYCDGACSGNQFTDNKGGWGAVLKFGNRVKEIYDGERNTSNQRMELTACIKALEQIKKTGYKIEIYSDSAYLVNCMQEKWYEKWIKNGWKNINKKPVENQDLWKRLLELLEKSAEGRRLSTRLYVDSSSGQVTFHKVEGHTGNRFNELADKLAQKGIKELDK